MGAETLFLNYCNRPYKQMNKLSDESFALVTVTKQFVAEFLLGDEVIAVSYGRSEFLEATPNSHEHVIARHKPSRNNIFKVVNRGGWANLNSPISGIPA
jgi:hypothetical protein